MTRTGVLLAISLGMADNLLAANSSIVLQQHNQQTNLFITGDTADALYDLLKKGVPLDSLPNGTFVEGGNMSCSKTVGTDNKYQTFCAFNMEQEGFTSGETPSFVPSIASMVGKIEAKDKKATGEIELGISGEVSTKLFSLLKASENKEGLKVAKNLLCQQKGESTSCLTVINQRGFADFPEARLSSPVDLNLNHPARGLR